MGQFWTFLVILIVHIVGIFAFMVPYDCALTIQSITARLRPMRVTSARWKKQSLFLTPVNSDNFAVASEWIVEEGLKGPNIRVVDYLAAAYFPSSTAAKKAVRRGLVTVDDSVVSSTDHTVKTGAVIRYHVRVSTDAYSREARLPEDQSASLILYEDDDMAVLNKPAGLDFDEINSLALRVLRPPSCETLEVLRRPSVVHRLDRPVGGAILVARTGAALRTLSVMFAEKRVQKEYTAIVMGRVDSGDGVHEINIPLQGKPSTTTYKVLAILPCAHSPIDSYVSVLSVRPKTGRTHQIRKHLAFIGHPILLDAKYANTMRGGNELNAWAADKCPELAATSIALFSTRLTLTIPVGPRNGQILSVQAPQRALVELLRAVKNG